MLLHINKGIVRDIIINKIASSKLVSNKIRVLIYKLCGLKICTKNIKPDCFMGGTDITIGKDTFINYGCFFDNSSSIEVGMNCNIAMQVMFCTSSHEIGDSEKRAGMNIGQPIKIEDGCWIGARAMILPGVTIGKGCVIAAGAVVTKDCEPNGLYIGVPAKRTRELSK